MYYDFDIAPESDLTQIRTVYRYFTIIHLHIREIIPGQYIAIPSHLNKTPSVISLTDQPSAAEMEYVGRVNFTDDLWSMSVGGGGFGHSPFASISRHNLSASLTTQVMDSRSTLLGNHSLGFNDRFVRPIVTGR